MERTKQRLLRSDVLSLARRLEEVEVEADFHLLFSALLMLFGVLDLGVAISFAQMQHATEVTLSVTLLFVTAFLGYRFLVRAVDHQFRNCSGGGGRLPYVMAHSMVLLRGLYRRVVYDDRVD